MFSDLHLFVANKLIFIRHMITNYNIQSNQKVRTMIEDSTKSSQGVPQTTSMFDFLLKTHLHFIKRSQAAKDKSFVTRKYNSTA